VPGSGIFRIFRPAEAEIESAQEVLDVDPLESACGVSVMPSHPDCDHRTSTFSVPLNSVK